MNRFLSSAAALSIGFSCACFMDVLVLLLSPRHDTVLHLVGPASALFIPALLNIAGFALLCFLLLAALQRFVLLRRIAMAGLTSLLPWIVTKDSCYLLDVTIPHRVSMSLFLGCLVLFLLLAFFPRSNRPAILRARAALHLTYLFLAFVGALFFAEAIYFGFAAGNLNQLPPTTPALASRTGTHSGRVLWIVLDELGHEQVFGHRLPSLQLPNFDRLRAQSTVFSDVQPAGIYTEIVLPDLLTGVAASEISTSSNGRHLTLIEPDHRRIPFQPTDTVFSDALSLGYRNAVVGWYVPYCRLLHPVLSSCFWTGQTDLSPYFPAHTIQPNLIHPLVRFLHKLPYFFVVPPGPTPDEIDEGKLHYADLVAINHATDQILANRENDFILIHAPIPHPEGIWNRDTHTFAVNRSAYIDNLALADDFLGHILATLQQQGDLDSSTIVVMGDHAWRTKLLWLHSRSWKPIDSLASNGGKFDPRPAYMVKLPLQQTPATISAEFPATRTRALLDQLLRRTISTPAQLQQFALSQESLTPPPPPTPTHPQNRAH